MCTCHHRFSNIFAKIKKVPPVLEPFSFGSNTANNVVTSHHTTSTSFNKAKEGNPSHMDKPIQHTSVLSSSSRAAGSRTRVICGLARGDLPVHFQWLKDGVHLSSKTTSTSHKFLPNFYSASSQKIFDSSSASKNSNARSFRLHETKKTGLEHSTTIQITTIDAFSSLLTISSLGDEHTGNYTCVATNPAGHAQYTASLTVKGDFWQHLLFCFSLHFLLLLSVIFYLAMLFMFYMLNVVTFLYSVYKN